MVAKKIKSFLAFSALGMSGKCTQFERITIASVGSAG